MLLSLETVLIASFGSALQELLHWHNVKKQLEADRYRRLLRSGSYWVITVAMIFAAGIAASIWYADAEALVQKRETLLFGVTFPLLLKQLAAAFLVEAKEKLGVQRGGDLAPKGGIREYLGIRQ